MEEIGGISFRVEAGPGNSLQNLEAIKKAAEAVRRSLESLKGTDVTPEGLRGLEGNLDRLRQGLSNSRRDKDTTSTIEYARALKATREEIERFAAALNNVGGDTNTAQRVRGLNAEIRATRELAAETNSLSRLIAEANARTSFRRQTAMNITAEKRQLERDIAAQRAAQDAERIPYGPQLPPTADFAARRVLAGAADRNRQVLQSTDFDALGKLARQLTPDRPTVQQQVTDPARAARLKELDALLGPARPRTLAQDLGPHLAEQIRQQMDATIRTGRSSFSRSPGPPNYPDPVEELERESLRTGIRPDRGDYQRAFRDLKEREARLELEVTKRRLQAEAEFANRAMQGARTRAAAAAEVDPNSGLGQWRSRQASAQTFIAPSQIAARVDATMRNRTAYANEATINEGRQRIAEATRIAGERLRTEQNRIDTDTGAYRRRPSAEAGTATNQQLSQMERQQVENDRAQQAAAAAATIAERRRAAALAMAAASAERLARRMEADSRQAMRENARTLTRQAPPPLSNVERQAAQERLNAARLREINRSSAPRSGGDEERLERIKEQLRSGTGPVSTQAQFLRNVQAQAGATGGASPLQALSQHLDEVKKKADEASAAAAKIGRNDVMPRDLSRAVVSIDRLKAAYEEAVEAERKLEGTSAGNESKAVQDRITQSFEKQLATIRAVQEAQRALNNAQRRVDAGELIREQRAARAVTPPQEPPKPPSPPTAPTPPPPDEEPRRRTRASASRVSPQDVAGLRQVSQEASAADDALAEASAEAANLRRRLEQIKFDNSSIEAATRSLDAFYARAKEATEAIRTAKTPEELGRVDTSSIRNIQLIRSEVEKLQRVKQASGGPQSADEIAQLDRLEAALKSAVIAYRTFERAKESAERNVGLPTRAGSRPAVNVGGTGQADGGDVTKHINAVKQAMRELPPDVVAAMKNVSSAVGGAAGGYDKLGASARRARRDASWKATIEANATDRAAEFDRLARSIRAVQTVDNVNLKINLTGNETPKQLERVERAMKEMRKGETLSLVWKTNAKTTEDDIARIADLLDALERRGVNVRVRADTRDAEEKIARTTTKAQLLQGAFRGFVAGSNIGGGLFIAGGGSPVNLAAAIAISATTAALEKAITTGVEYNAVIERNTVAFTHFTGSANLAAEAIDRLREFAADTPFSTGEALSAGRSFMALEGGDIARVLEDVDLAGQLAAVSRKGFTEGFQDAQVAIRELLGGQTQSFATRFDISRESLNNLKEAGLVGRDLVKAAVAMAGGSKQLLDAFQRTGEFQLAKFTDEIERLVGVLTKPLFDFLTQQLTELNQWLDNNKSTTTAWANTVGKDIAEAARTAVSAINLVIGAIKALEDVLNSGQRVGLEINEWLTGSPSDALQRRRREEEQARQKAAQEASRQADIDAGRAPARATPTGGTPSNRVLSDVDRERQARIDAANDARDAAVGAVSAEEKALKNIERQLNANQAAAARVSLQYARQKFELEEALEVLNRTDFGDRRIQVDIDLRRNNLESLARQAEAPVDVRADAAAQEVHLNHAKELIEIDQRRRAIIQEIGDLQISIANQVREAQIRASQAVLEALQEEVRARREAAQEALDGLRERQRAASEARREAIQGAQEAARASAEANRDAIEGVRERHQAESEARRDEIEGIQEAIRLRRQGVQDHLDGLREVLDAQNRAAEEQNRSLDRAHARSQQAIQDEIDRLQRQNRDEERRQSGPTPAERELKALEEADRVRQRAISLASAERNVRLARTGRERADAIQNLRELRAQQAVDARREELQRKIAAEQEARDKRREAREDKIYALQQKAAAQDRAYQEEKERREDAQRAAREAAEKEIREIEKAEKQRQRQEDEQVRALEKANREADKKAKEEERALEKAAQQEERAYQAQIRALEAADREATKREQEELRKAEKAEKEIQKREEAEIRRQQKAINDEQRKLQEEAAKRQIGNDRQRLKDLQQSAPIELELLKQREKVLKEENVALKAYIAAAGIRLDDEESRFKHIKNQRDLRIEIARIDTEERLQALNEKEALRTREMRLQLITLGLQKTVAQEALDLATKAVEKATEALRLLNDAEKKTAANQAKADTPDSTNPLEWRFWQQSAMNQIATQIGDGIYNGAVSGWERAKKAIADAGLYDDAGLFDPAVWSEAGRLAGEAFTQGVEQESEIDGLTVVGQGMGEDLISGLISSISERMQANAATVEEAVAAPIESATDSDRIGIAASAAGVKISDTIATQIAENGTALQDALAGSVEGVAASESLGAASAAAATAVTDQMAANLTEQGTKVTDAITAPVQAVAASETLQTSASQAATAVSDALVNGLLTNASRVQDALGAPFAGFASSTAADTAKREMAQLALNLTEAFRRGLEVGEGGRTIADVVDAEIKKALDKAVSYKAKFKTAGEDAAKNWITGWRTIMNRDGVTNIDRTMNTLIRRLQRQMQNFKTLGGNAATSWCNGWAESMSRCECQTCQAGGSGGAGGGGSSGGGGSIGGEREPTTGEIAQAMMNPATHRAGASGYWEVFVRGRWWTTRARVDRNQDPTGGRTASQPQTRAVGGTINAGETYRLHAGEVVTPRQAGTVLPQTVVRGLERVGQLGQSANQIPAGAGEQNIHLTIHQTNSFGNSSSPEQAYHMYAEQTMGLFVDALKQVTQTTQSKVRRTLPGAV